MKVPAQLAQFIQQAPGGVKGQRNAFHVQHRLGKAGVNQHVAPVMHIGELMGWRGPTLRLIQITQF
jgi:hypothetical protein